MRAQRWQRPGAASVGRTCSQPQRLLCTGSSSGRRRVHAAAQPCLAQLIWPPTGPHGSCASTSTFTLRGRHTLAPPRASAVAEAPAPPQSDSTADAAENGAVGPLPPPQRPESAAELPEDLRKVTAVLTAQNPDAPGGRSLVYVLGMSHVSRRSVDQVQQLIRMVQPEVVMVELCKDRVTGLVDRDAVEMARSHCAKVKISGLPNRKGWPTEQQLLALIRTRPGEAVAYQDIEEDPSRLLSTGLFKSCRPVVFPPKRAGEFYPTFLQDQETGALKALRPIGTTEFILTPRQLPPIMELDIRLDSSLRSSGIEVPPEALETAKKAALEAASRKAKRVKKTAPAAADSKADGTAEAAATRADETTDAAAADAETSEKDAAAEGEAAAEKQREADAKKQEAAAGPVPTVDVLMALRADLLAAAHSAGLREGSIEVLFQGTDSSRVEAVLRAVPEDKVPSVSGLESTAPNGDGEGIEPFRAQPRLVEIGLSMRVPLDKVAENLPPRLPPAPMNSSAAAPECRTPWRRWTEADEDAADEEAKSGKRPDPTGGPGGIFASWLTSQYAKFQDAAGLTAGVETGEAWRAAFRAASDSGASLLLLGDRPSLHTARRMGNAIARRVAPLFGGACAISLAADIAAAKAAVPDGLGGYAVLAGLATVAASLLPILGPILEVRALSKLPADRIEEAVQVPEPLQNADGGGGAVKLWGEDALLDWPGAMGPVIDERDEFMAKTLAAAATGKAALAPALAADTGADGAPLWRYVMGADGPAGISPLAEGDGQYQPLPGVGAVVAVVGTAHVRGIVRAWDNAQQDATLEQYVDYIE